MEAYAAMLDNADQNVGKLVKFLQSIDQIDNTIILFTSDNGGTDAGGVNGMVNNNRRYSGLPPQNMAYERSMLAQLGGPQSIPLYPTAWGEVSNTPFPSFKTYTGGGGRRVSFIISWPARLKDHGSTRRQFMHVTDVMPTLLEMAGVRRLEFSHGEPALPFDGLSCASSLIADAPSPRREQYYECWSNRAYYRDGWLARSLQIRDTPIDMQNWTLHNLDIDFSESTDLAGEYPQILAELVDAFDKAAWKYDVYPLDNRGRPGKFSDTPQYVRERANKPRRFLPGSQTAHRIDVMPLVSNRSFKIRARFCQNADDEGILWALGDTIAGIVMYVKADRLHCHYNGFGEHTDLEPIAIVPGWHEAILEYEALGGHRGRGRLLAATAVRNDWCDLSPPMALGPFEGLDVGVDRRAPVYWDLFKQHGTYRYSGTIEMVTIEPGAHPEIKGDIS